MSDHHPNIVADCESWFFSSVASLSIFPTGYSIYRCDTVGVMELSSSEIH